MIYGVTRVEESGSNHQKGTDEHHGVVIIGNMVCGETGVKGSGSKDGEGADDHRGTIVVGNTTYGGRGVEEKANNVKGGKDSHRGGIFVVDTMCYIMLYYEYISGNVEINNKHALLQRKYGTVVIHS